MAIKKIEIRAKGAGNYQDLVYPKTSADMVMVDSNWDSVQDALDGFMDVFIEHSYAIGLLLGVKGATITATGWQGSSAPYTQAVTVFEMAADHNPIITPEYSTVNATAVNQKEAWNLIGKAITGEGVITFTCFGDKPTIDIPIKIKGA